MSKKTDQRKKRLGKTSPEQYEEYLRVMEQDSIFRSGSINPTIDPDYIQKKWESLTRTLNSCGWGPELAVAEWKKRFSDWKHATRAKYRRIVEHSKQTGGGPPTEQKLTPLEDRGITVWGRVAVTGTPKVSVVGGLQAWQSVSTQDQQSTQDSFEFTQGSSGGQNQFSLSSDGSESPLINYDYEPLSETAAELVQRQKLLPESSQDRKASRSSTSRGSGIQEKTLFDKIKANKQKNKILGHRPLPVISEELLSVYKKNVDNENKTSTLEEKKLSLEYNKFRFEVAKYKFENPGFTFEIDEFRD